MKQVFLLILGAIAFIIAVGLLTQKMQNQDNPFNLKPVSTPPVQQSITIKDTKILIEVVDSEEERQKGLSQRNSLDQNSGMLFVFENKDVKPSFWMKDMLIPIDIIWINDDRITQIDKRIDPPESGTPDNKLKIYKATTVVDYVLEVNAGLADNHQFAIGDKVDTSSFNK